MLKKLATSTISSISSSEKPASRNIFLSELSTLLGFSVSLKEKSFGTKQNLMELLEKY